MTRAVVFAYSEVGVRCVRELLTQEVQIPLLFTHADDPGEQRWFGSVRSLAEAHRIRVEMPDDPNTLEWLAEGRRARPDFLFSFYYRHMLNAGWLALPKRGALNMHGSLLPKFRGRAPVHWAIIHGETVTGASLHYMLEKPDAGALVDQQAVPILENETALEISLKVADAAQAVLARSLPKLIAGSAHSRALDPAQGSYYGRRRPEDGRIDWRASARAIHDLVRAVAPPFPGAFTEVNGLRLEVLETRVDANPVRYPGRAPCLYAESGEWYADCTDGRRLKILKLAAGGEPIGPDSAPAALSNPPLALG
ncbi:MAG TPA: formyltransferase [Steroidobacteraceae bacterium]|nr:formyltransferase [Steroidobacteraceae bacterium]